jgi:enoyl-[acyl-carrier-protein] reductase (NADH)
MVLCDVRDEAQLTVVFERVATQWGKLDYPFHDRTVTVTRCGRICFNGQ